MYVFKHGKSSVKLKKVLKNALTLFYMIAMWESDMSEIRFEIFRLKSPIESVSLISWGRLFHRRAPTVLNSSCVAWAGRVYLLGFSNCILSGGE